MRSPFDRNRWGSRFVSDFMKPFLIWLTWTALAVMVGFGLAWVALAVVDWVLPPFRYPQDDDTLRERVPALIAYATWAIVSVVGSVAAWRRVRARSA